MRSIAKQLAAAVLALGTTLVVAPTRVQAAPADGLVHTVQYYHRYYHRPYYAHRSYGGGYYHRPYFRHGPGFYHRGYYGHGYRY